MEKDFVYILLDQLGGDNKELHRINPDTFFQRPDKKITFFEFEKAVKNLFSRVFKVKNEASGGLAFYLINSMETLPDENSIEIRINPMIKPYLLELKKTLNNQS